MGTAGTDGGAGGPGGMAASEERAERLLLVVLMERMAAGDGGAACEFAAAYSVPLSAAIRRALAARGCPTVSADDLQGLVLEAALEVFTVARAWQPAGAPPWVWAGHRIANLVDRHLGQFAEPLPEPGREQARADQTPPPARGGVEPGALTVLARCAEDDAVCELLRAALDEVASPRDQELFLEVRLQDSLGDRSPAATVARAYGLRADAVRQQVHRVRRRLADLAATDPRFAALAGLPLVAGASGSQAA